MMYGNSKKNIKGKPINQAISDAEKAGVLLPQTIQLLQPLTIPPLINSHNTTYSNFPTHQTLYGPLDDDDNDWSNDSYEDDVYAYTKISHSPSSNSLGANSAHYTNHPKFNNPFSGYGNVPANNMNSGFGQPSTIPYYPYPLMYPTTNQMVNKQQSQNYQNSTPQNQINQNIPKFGNPHPHQKNTFYPTKIHTGGCIFTSQNDNNKNYSTNIPQQKHNIISMLQNQQTIIPNLKEDPVIFFGQSNSESQVKNLATLPKQSQQTETKIIPKNNEMNLNSKALFNKTFIISNKSPEEQKKSSTFNEKPQKIQKKNEAIQFIQCLLSQAQSLTQSINEKKQLKENNLKKKEYNFISDIYQQNTLSNEEKGESNQKTIYQIPYLQQSPSKADSSKSVQSINNLAQNSKNTFNADTQEKYSPLIKIHQNPNLGQAASLLSVEKLSQKNAKNESKETIKTEKKESFLIDEEESQVQKLRLKVKELELLNQSYLKIIGNLSETVQNLSIGMAQKGKSEKESVKVKVPEQKMAQKKKEEPNKPKEAQNLKGIFLQEQQE